MNKLSRVNKLCHAIAAAFFIHAGMLCSYVSGGLMYADFAAYSGALAAAAIAACAAVLYIQTCAHLPSPSQTYSLLW